MYCSTCGFESTQKTNYCKRCGATLSSPGTTTIVNMPALQLTGGFLVIAAFVYFGLKQIFSMYMNMMYSGIRGPSAELPFVLGLVLIGAVALLLIWQLSRLISLARKQVDQAANQERPKFVEVQPAQITMPTDPLGTVADRPSVIEHTTRQMAGAYRESNVDQ